MYLCFEGNSLLRPNLKQSLKSVYKSTFMEAVIYVLDHPVYGLLPGAEPSSNPSLTAEWYTTALTFKSDILYDFFSTL